MPERTENTVIGKQEQAVEIRGEETDNDLCCRQRLPGQVLIR